MEESTKRELRKCAFCGRTEREVAFLIPDMERKCYICDNCIDLCSEFIENHLAQMEQDDGADEEKLTFETLPRPKEIKEMLDLHVYISFCSSNHTKEQKEQGRSKKR